MASEVEETGDRCARCNRVGEDRRTLWHACLYEMSELSIPFEQRTLVSIPKDSEVKLADSPVTIPGTDINISSGSVTTDAKLRPMVLYTLFVCKECRSDWMKALEHWFEDGNRWGERIVEKSTGG